MPSRLTPLETNLDSNLEGLCCPEKQKNVIKVADPGQTFNSLPSVHTFLQASFSQHNN